MVAVGIMLAADGLLPSSKGARISFGGTGPKVIEPPFAEPKELIAGFWMINISSREEAITWARRAPFPSGELEIRRGA